MLKAPKWTLALLFSAVAAASLHAQAPTIATNGTVNGADYSRDFAPGSIISIFGSNLATATGGAMTVPLPTTLGGATVQITAGGSTQSLPLFYVSPGQINAQLPYGLSAGSSAQITVMTAGGTSAADTVSIKARAPKIFTVNYSGTGSGIVTDPEFNLLSTTVPAKPADAITIWMTGLGETTPSVTAGTAAPGSTQGSTPATLTGVTVMIDGKPATVTFAGLAPGYAGLYQVNVKAPLSLLSGPLAMTVTASSVTSQANVTVPYRAMGYYNAVVGGKAVSGSLVSGTQAFAFRQEDALAWGDGGYKVWTKLPTTNPPIDGTVQGLAITMKNGSTIIYDNNGIETSTTNNFYSNAGGLQADSTKPGFSNLFSMSNYYPLVFASTIHLASDTTISEVIGYFDGNNVPTLPFDPTNPYLKYRVNIWRGTSSIPTDTGNFTGNALSSDSTAGTVTVSRTAVNRISSSALAAPDPIWRVSYKLTTPVTLTAGDYWVSHDASLRETPVSSSSDLSITIDELSSIMREQVAGKTGSARQKVNFYGREMTYEEGWSLPLAVQIKPSAKISTNE